MRHCLGDRSQMLTHQAKESHAYQTKMPGVQEQLICGKEESDAGYIDSRSERGRSRPLKRMETFREDLLGWEARQMAGAYGIFTLIFIRRAAVPTAN